MSGSDKRTSLVRKNIFFSFLIKGWSGLVYLLMVPLTLNCLGEYRNGVWLTISSLLIWIDNLDIGLGNGLRNKLAAYLAHGDTTKAREAVSSTFFMLVLIIVPVAVLLALLVHVCDLYGFLNVDPSRVVDLNDVVIVALIFVCSTFIFKFIGNFYMGLQLPAVNNLLVTTGHTLALAATWVLWKSGSHSLMLITIVNTASPLVVYLLAYPYTFFVKYPLLRPSFRCFNRQVVNGLFGLGVKFFVLQICGALLFMSSNILISKLFNPALVTPYQIAYRYFSLVLILFTIMSNPLWTATTDAYERGDIEWIRRSRHRMNRILLVIATGLLLMVLLSKIVYHFWVGDGVVIPWTVTICMAVYIAVLVGSLNFSVFLNGIGVLRLQLVLTVMAAVLFIPLTYLLAGLMSGIESILIAMILVNTPGLVCNKIQFDKILKGTAKGIWKK